MKDKSSQYPCDGRLDDVPCHDLDGMFGFCGDGIFACTYYNCSEEYCEQKERGAKEVEKENE